MKIRSVRGIFFSPTKNTKKIIETIVAGIGYDVTDYLNLTVNGAGDGDCLIPTDELAVIGVPVYGGRLPAAAVKRLACLKGEQTPAVLVALYGNRHYDDALLELKDLAVSQGFIPVSGSAFIGVHSFNSEETPIASGRPDRHDLEKAKDFGIAVRKKLESVTSFEDITSPEIPGDFPYLEWSSPEGAAPVSDGSLCTLCGSCVEVCPVGAVKIKDKVLTDTSSCIICSACVKICQVNARSWDDPRILNSAARLSENCSERREPETFL